MTADAILSVLPNGISIIPEPEYACTLCQDKGYIVRREDGGLYARECECQQRKRTMKRIEQSGIADLLQRYTFESYETPKQWQVTAKEKAADYLEHGQHSWFIIAGNPGSGKTHLCTAIVGKLIEGNKFVRYMLWREEAPRLKASINDREWYDAEMDKLKRCDVLYIDDFLKGNVTDGDINLAFELLNDRYNTGRQTIISGERPIEAILDIDEAVGSRIYERTKGYRIRCPEENWRLR